MIEKQAGLISGVKQVLTPMADAARKLFTPKNTIGEMHAPGFFSNSGATKASGMMGGVGPRMTAPIAKPRVKVRADFNVVPVQKPAEAPAPDNKYFEKAKNWVSKNLWQTAGIGGAGLVAGGVIGHSMTSNGNNQ